MRVVVVSSHYPPDFVSGGTLVPQRLAAGLAERGHQVSVFAGHLHDNVPLRTWDEVVDGLPVRWISIRTFTHGGSRLGYDNPGVAAAFAAYLDEVRPEVVHLHSLQTFGAGLLPVARERGIVVVVTMHDFWWTCARQFLVAPDHRPCSLVVSAGVCPCASSARWLRDRDAWMLRQLQAADLILAPSASAARVLVANGVDLGRLRVDENGLPGLERPVATPVSRHPAPDEVRLLFTGGRDPMKGLPVLAEAMAYLADIPGWRLDAYGVEDAAWARHDARVSLLPRYDPSELPAVLGVHDVLVLPSLMRESFSIVTREGLQAGLAVVCTDTLGPEEAVDDGVNGLVVPAGDAVSLGFALRRLVEDRALLARLRSRDPDAEPSLRSVAEQVDGLVDAYRTLLSTGPAPRATPSLRRVLFVAGIDGAPLRYRAHLPAEALRLLGVQADVRHYRDRSVLELARRADAVVLYRVPATTQVLDLMAAVRRRSPAVPLVFDVDDLIFDEGVRPHVRGIDHLPPAEQELWWEGVRRYRTTMDGCDLYVGSTAQLCRHAQEVTALPARRFANGVGVLLGQLSDAALRRPRTPGPLRMGYFSGTDTHDHDWAVAEPAVVRILADHPAVELWLGGHLRPSAALEPFRSRVRTLPFVAWQELPALLRDLDVNLAPLTLDNPFNEAKSAIKWLEAALVATPTVASPTEPFREAVTDGVDGLLAPGEDAWYAALSRLLSDDGLRRAMGERARRSALLGWSPHVQAERYVSILSEAVELVTRLPRPAPPPPLAARDEPADGSILAPYDAPSVVPLLNAGPRPTALGPRLVDAGRRYRRAAGASLRDDGPVATAGETLRVLRRLPPRAARAARARRSR